MQGVWLPDGTATEAGAAACKECMQDFVFGNIHALVKAGDIWARGLRMLNTACVGSVLMGVDESIAQVQARMKIPGVGSLVDLDVDTARCAISRSVARWCLLSRMTGQLAGDSLVPLQRRVGAAFDTVDKLTA